jgi:hypothetical protein
MTRNEPLTWVGVAGFEPAASSSRSQLAMRTARAAVSLTWEATSADIRRGPSLTTAIVTHLVTRSCCTLGAALTISLGMSVRGGHNLPDRRSVRTLASP